ncbi:LacI family transcriptional regulator, partial [bacterium]
MPRRKNEPGHPRRVTMQDIADAAGVHLMTVSNALGNTRNVAPETREKVLRIAQELNYRPNLLARSLVAGRVGTVAVISGDISEPYYGSMVHMLKERMDADGYHLTLLDKPHEIVDLANATGNALIDGVIGIDLFPAFVDVRSQPTVPIVSVGTYERAYMDYVVVDLSSAVEEALEMMWRQGRKRIAYVVNTGYLAEPAEVRAGSYLKFMARVGQPPEIINADTDQFPVV